MTVGTRQVVLLPSLGRPATDFDTLCVSLGEAGFEPHAIDPLPSWEGAPTLHDLADEVRRTMAERGISSAHIIGHAFGNRLARMFTADHPDCVATLTLLAAGGYVPIAPSIDHSLLSCFDESLSQSEHLEHVRRAFFAEGNDPSVWSSGWMPTVARYQRGAVVRTDRAEWWDAVALRVLVVQALDDVIAVPENGRRYVADHPDCATLLEISGAGHAMLPERPSEIAAGVLEFLQRSP